MSHTPFAIWSRYFPLLVKHSARTRSSSRLRRPNDKDSKLVRFPIRLYSNSSVASIEGHGVAFTTSARAIVSCRIDGSTELQAGSPALGYGCHSSLGLRA